MLTQYPCMVMVGRSLVTIHKQLIIICVFSASNYENAAVCSYFILCQFCIKNVQPFILLHHHIFLYSLDPTKPGDLKECFNVASIDNCVSLYDMFRKKTVWCAAKLLLLCLPTTPPPSPILMKRCPHSSLLSESCSCSVANWL